jgi:hypothetical protein
LNAQSFSHKPLPPQDEYAAWCGALCEPSPLNPTLPTQTSGANRLLLDPIQSRTPEGYP